MTDRAQVKQGYDFPTVQLGLESEVKLINTAEIAYSNKAFSEDSREQLDKWLSWVREHADRIDPLNGQPPYVQ